LLDLMQKNSINRAKIDWNDLRARVYILAAGAKSVEDLYPAIGVALTQLADRHTIYFPKTGNPIARGGCATVAVSTLPISTPEVPSTVGYIRVTGFSGTATEAVAFSDRILETIKTADSRGVTSWLVDLRQNSGGNMWPMLAGLSPILGEGPLGYFINPLGEKVEWGIRDGVVYTGGPTYDPNQATYRLQNKALRIAVLTDALTSSSGEAVTIAFRGLPHARSFGTQTCGLSTSNRSYPLSDGGLLALTVSVMADRTAKPYGGPVVPDEVIDDPAKMVERALAWLATGK
ncbi:MAG TPA: S41 family peptidase, partial [Candidatus Sulfotelmatobacter sp.]|nr:S41 family peptidase [Candidatus Sulfotelmatobacter sp.]